LTRKPTLEILQAIKLPPAVESKHAHHVVNPILPACSSLFKCAPAVGLLTSTPHPTKLIVIPRRVPNLFGPEDRLTASVAGKSINAPVENPYKRQKEIISRMLWITIKKNVKIALAVTAII
jgi:hypothetical protein